MMAQPLKKADSQTRSRYSALSDTFGAGLMKDHGQQARVSENFAGPVDFETPRPDLPVHFLNFQKPWLFSLALACWPWSFISPGLVVISI